MAASQDQTVVLVLARRTLRDRSCLPCSDHDILILKTYDCSWSFKVFIYCSGPFGRLWFPVMKGDTAFMCVFGLGVNVFLSYDAVHFVCIELTDVQEQPVLFCCMSVLISLLRMDLASICVCKLTVKWNFCVLSRSN